MIKISKYTTEVRYICENFAGLKESSGYLRIPEILDKTWDKIFFEPVEFFDTNYKQVLCKKILRHYYMWEIGFETAGLWIFEMNTKLQEIMPYYNKLYESALLSYNPFNDIDLTKTNLNKSQKTTEDTEAIKENNETMGVSQTNDNVTDNSRRNSFNVSSGTDKNSENITDNEKNMFSDTPQGSITNLENGNYLTDARVINKKSENISNGETHGENELEETNKYTSKKDSDLSYEETKEGNINRNKKQELKNTDDFIEKIYGKSSSASYSELLLKFRETFLNIDMMVIEEFQNLFMSLW